MLKEEERRWREVEDRNMAEDKLREDGGDKQEEKEE